jgi:NAD(P)-dependent dehydrogenase (short-subunit alcohol dehydrogenase family)
MGAATVSAFVRQGVTRLAIADVQVSKLEAIASQVSASKSGIKILPITCDVADEESVKAMVKATVDTYGRIDYAVNCAGIMGQVAPAATASTELYRRTVGVNQDGIL